MDPAWVTDLLDWLAASPGWATAIIFVIALCEGIVGAGLIVPGATLLFIAGGLVGTGHLELWPSLAAAFAGAFIGDSISYVLGRCYGTRLRGAWPLRRYPRALARGDALFASHGGKALVIGRFVGPVRGIIPAIAGMMRMPPRYFFVVNLLSALPWAPAYLLPGLVFGASLAVAASVALRLVAVLLLALFGGWALWWMARRLVLPRLRRLTALLAWRVRLGGRLHPLAARVLSGPRMALRAFSYPAGWVWWAAVAALAALTLRQAWLGPPTLVDEALLGLLTMQVDPGLRASLSWVALVLEPAVWGAAWLAGVAWLLGQRRLRVAAVLTALVPGAALTALLLGVAAGGWRPVALYSGAPALAYPAPDVAAFTALILASGVLATVAYGGTRRTVQVLGVAVPLLAAAASVAVGDRWLADAVGGLLLGVVVSAVVVWAGTGPGGRAPAERGLPLVVGAVLAVALALAAATVGPAERDRVIAQAERPSLSVSEWVTLGPADALNRELRWLDGGRRPVDLQWLASGEAMAERLAEAGWQRPERRLHGALRWLQPEPQLGAMAPLPRWYRGRLPEQAWVRPAGAGARAVLRLWPASVAIADGGQRLWLVSLEVEAIQPGWPVAHARSRLAEPGERVRLVHALRAEGELWIRQPGQPARLVPVDRVGD